MNVGSSIFHLFRQSRYARYIDHGEVSSKHNRCEVFAVAAVAFTAKHDPQFAANLLVQIAGVPRQDMGNKFSIEVQSADHADLLIRDEIRLLEYIVEFKVNASVQEKQSPLQRAFWARGGYGWQIKNESRKKKFECAAYTLLSQHVEFDDFVVEGITCRARSWKDLIPRSGIPESLLVTDLLDSIGSFGVSALRVRNIQGMKNAGQVQGAIRVHELMEALLVDFLPVPLDIGRDDHNSWCGMPLNPRKSQHARLRKWLGHEQKHLGWIGYLVSNGSSEASLSVWLYFAPNRVAHLEESARILRTTLPGTTIEPSVSNPSELIISQKAGEISDEKEWFNTVLEKVLHFKAGP